MNLKQFFESLAQSLPQYPDEEASAYLLYQSEKDDFPCPSPKISQRATPPSHVPSLIPFWLPWLLTVFFAFLSLYFSLRDVPSEIWGSYASGWNSDFGPAQPLIDLQHSSFVGSAIPRDGSPPGNSVILEMQGPPSDEAWHHILGGQYFLITEEEARQTWGDDFEQHWDYTNGGYRASVGVLHALHCVVSLPTHNIPINIKEVLIEITGLLPKLTSTDLAMAEAGNYMALSHKMHCLGQIRQYITCHADLTPMPSFFGRGYPDQTTPHTCRNFDKIRDWVWERHNGSIAVLPDYTKTP